MIVTVMVSAGQEVAVGQALLVLESMKMENQIKAPRAGTIEHIQVTAGERVEQNRPLLTLL
jgi:biotin carboxyl carrier protein